jgi:hypothetical protein
LHTGLADINPAPEYARLVLTFTTGFADRFDGGQTFGFGASNHFITSFTPDVVIPEPATYAMVGLALAGFGMLKFKRRKPLKKS